MKKNAKTQAQYKKILDKVFSQYIRQKYSNRGMGECYTCFKKANWKELQCGHFLSRSYLATRFDERNCRPQCVGCNVFGGGRQAMFAERLSKELGKGIIEKLYKEARRIVKDYPYEEKINEYKEKLKEFENLV